MPAKTPELRRAASRAGTAVRYSHPDADEARADLAVLRITAYVEKVVAAAPPLSSDQRCRLASLLHPTSGAAA